MFQAILASIPITAKLLDKRQGRSCSSVPAPTVEGATVVSISGQERNGSSTGDFPVFPRQSAGGSLANEVCEVNVILTHEGANDTVRIAIWLPLSGWNGKFQGTGGGGLIAGEFDSALAPAVQLGYAAGSTDAGLPSNSFDGTEWAGNEQLLKNFAHLSIHEMSVVGKQVAESFYSSPVEYSYWNGCSTGGRQGYMEAQRYPEDYDGILAIAPAINFNKMAVASAWPYAVMKEEGEFPQTCVWDAMVQAAIDQCDMDDGGDDDLISDPPTCDFNPFLIVGQNMSNCSITERHATIARKIIDGPVDASGDRLWYGLEPGTTFTGLATTTVFSISDGWIRNWVRPGYNTSNLNYDNFPGLFQQAVDKFDDLIGTSNPDLSGFAERGGKLLTWHGWADQLIFPQGTSDYRQRVQDTMGDGVDGFYRLFFAPGVQHCSGGNGPVPIDPLADLVAWVEQGQAPETLAAMSGSGSMAGNPSGNPSSGAGNGSQISRDLCLWPESLIFSGSGDVNAASTWTCAP
ncbi:Tannase/feruloyl esterase [Lineolata rhizophorae]|uniref:Carboxylic ester hydrolase n=1 Tax=Lineolata rhizophorae TaxID=578093 RepID=A0A6A6NQA3_9PEZI|nr:Tannase/feruloyl esterase [Lineolata rhizophorae]